MNGFFFLGSCIRELNFLRFKIIYTIPGDISYSRNPIAALKLNLMELSHYISELYTTDQFDKNPLKSRAIWWKKLIKAVWIDQVLIKYPSWALIW